MNNTSQFHLKPLHKNGLPPCNNACPAGEKIQAWIRLVQNKKLQQAWELIMQDNPLPAIHGRICYHNCEKNCNRLNFDSSVKIHCIETFLGDLALDKNWTVNNDQEIKHGQQEQQDQQLVNSNRKILIIGAGPAGLSSAYHLSKLGYNVTIYDNQQQLGGMMFKAIPEFRLPSDILYKETQRLIHMMHIHVKLNHAVTDVMAEKKQHNFDAVFLAIGSHKPKMLSINNDNSVLQCSAIDFLTLAKHNNTGNNNNKDNNSQQVSDINLDVNSETNLDTNTNLDVNLSTIDISKIKHLVVYGGSNTAMDVARTAIRLGIQHVTIVYHRSLERMNAHKTEIQEALDEGVTIKVLRQIECISNKQLVLNIVALDEKGNPQATGKQEKLDIDLLVFAMGQKTNSDFLHNIPNLQFNSNGQILVDDNLMTGEQAIFAGGDAIPTSEQSITMATGHGKKVAKCIDTFLQNTTLSPNTATRISAISINETSNNETPISYQQLNLWFKDQHASLENTQCNENFKKPKNLEETKNFEEMENIETFADIENIALYEAQRCFSCGTCFECDGCYAICPNQAIIKLGYRKGYKIDYALCNNCGLCYTQCPCCAIMLEDVSD